MKELYEIKKEAMKKIIKKRKRKKKWKLKTNNSLS